MSPQVIHYDFCRRCGRSLKLWNEYDDRQYGPVCRGHLRGPIAALRASGNPAAYKAARLLEEGGLARLQGHGGHVWRTVSEDALRDYLTFACTDGIVMSYACNCKSGLYGKLCYHAVAVSVMLAS